MRSHCRGKLFRIWDGTSLPKKRCKMGALLCSCLVMMSAYGLQDGRERLKMSLRTSPHPLASSRCCLCGIQGHELLCIPYPRVQEAGEPWPITLDFPHCPSCSSALPHLIAKTHTHSSKKKHEGASRSVCGRPYACPDLDLGCGGGGPDARPQPTLWTDQDIRGLGVLARRWELS